jgi:hypothetical protein
MGLKHMTCCLPSDVLKDAVLVDENKSYDTNLKAHEKVSYDLNKIFGTNFQGNGRTAP